MSWVGSRDLKSVGTSELSDWVLISRILGRFPSITKKSPRTGVLCFIVPLVSTVHVVHTGELCTSHVGFREGLVPEPTRVAELSKTKSFLPRVH